ncbi:MAG TPA: GNAT family protein [Lachnospiraceae bacterium]|nr:GNAT family protein [Lachnospiraceae bacterium]
MEAVIRKWKKSDAKSVAKYANNENIAKNLRNVFPYPYTLADAEGYVYDCVERGDDRRLVRAIEVNKEAVGSIGIFLGCDVAEKSAELGYWLAEKYWKQGIMSSAVKQLCAEAFLTFDLVRIYAEPFSYNEGSKAVLKKAGFTYEGTMRSSVFKNGRMFDQCLYSLLKNEIGSIH